MTQYLTGHPFTVPVCPGKLTTEEYFVRVGALKYCEACKKNVAIKHKHPEASRVRQGRET
jgi:hypothetical protein